jgi:hypothetical protein
MNWTDFESPFALLASCAFAGMTIGFCLHCLVFAPSVKWFSRFSR